MPLSLPVDLNSPGWVLRYSNSWTAQLIEEGRYAPIPEQSISSSFSSPILAITLVTLDIVSYTKFGYIKQVKAIGTGQNAVTGARRIWRGTQVIRFSDAFEGNYALTFKPFFRLRQVTMIVYEFQSN